MPRILWISWINKTDKQEMLRILEYVESLRRSNISEKNINSVAQFTLNLTNLRLPNLFHLIKY